MIIELCLNLVVALLRLLLLPFQVAQLPATFASTFLILTGYLIDGFRVVAAYIDTVYIGALFSFVFSVGALANGYRFIMWFLKKIPFLNIK